MDDIRTTGHSVFVEKLMISVRPKVRRPGERDQGEPGRTGEWKLH